LRQAGCVQGPEAGWRGQRGDRVQRRGWL
jgi:hypothetical protein